PDHAIPLLGLPMAAIGLRGLVRRKPVVVRSSWLLWPLALGVALTILWAILRTPDPEFDLGVPMRLLMPAVLLFVVIDLWIRLRGYLVVGARPDSVRESLRAALHRLSLPFEESDSRFRVPSLGAELALTYRSAKPFVGLKVRRGGNRALLGQVAGALRAVLHVLPGRARLAPFVVLFLLGALCTGAFVLDLVAG
ncbi:MAG: hypothetical protein ACREIU_00565, partial [Planctomycetota bacterium]